MREQLVTTVLKNGKPIVAAVVKEAKKGKYLPAKYLFEFAKISEPLPSNDGRADEPTQSLAEILKGATQNDQAAANTPASPNAPNMTDQQSTDTTVQKTS